MIVALPAPAQLRKSLIFPLLRALTLALAADKFYAQAHLPQFLLSLLERLAAGLLPQLAKLLLHALAPAEAVLPCAALQFRPVNKDCAMDERI